MPHLTARRDHDTVILQAFLQLLVELSQWRAFRILVSICIRPWQPTRVALCSQNERSPTVQRLLWWGFRPSQWRTLTTNGPHLSPAGVDPPMSASAVLPVARCLQGPRPSGVRPGLLENDDTVHFDEPR